MDDEDFDLSPSVNANPNPSLRPSTSYERLRENLTNQGYRSGLHAGEDSTVQQGFKEGLSLLAPPLGLRVGRLRGRLQAIAMLLRKAKRFEEEAEAKKLLESVQGVWFLHRVELGDKFEKEVDLGEDEIVAVEGREGMEAQQWKREGRNPEEVMGELEEKLKTFLEKIPLRI
ncbi:hypothetical protein BT69DRAFT_1319425 [Atractiella rhizophila]|nr:hypothetical protein BT69DRAFT_1320506 [Atractiella rhizophila]KAH8923595.1 hypothetical protein BT69DRAFT_1319425 [Atractiella rhizophila]